MGSRSTNPFRDLPRMRSMVGGAAIVVAVALLLATTAVLGQGRDMRGGGGERLFVDQGCYGCHQIGKFGTPIGPALSRVGAKYPAAYLRQWLRDPQSVRPTAHMPRLGLTAEEVDVLSAYLSSLK
jgi:mono/diheme cytochrome c family protein